MINKVREKRDKGYRVCDELILAIYNASPINFYLTLESWTGFFDHNQAELSDIDPFTEIFFYNLPKRGYLVLDPVHRRSRPCYPRPYPTAFVVSRA